MLVMVVVRWFRLLERNRRASVEVCFPYSPAPSKVGRGRTNMVNNLSRCMSILPCGGRLGKERKETDVPSLCRLITEAGTAFGEDVMQA